MSRKFRGYIVLYNIGRTLTLFFLRTAMGGEEAKDEDSALEPPFPDGMEDNDGLEG